MKTFLSYALDEDTPTYGNRDKFTIEPQSKIVNGVGANTSTWKFSNNHIGTHMDTPHHFYESGKKTLDYSAEDFCFNSVHFLEKIQTSGELFTLSENELSQIPTEVEFLIIKTGYGAYRTIDKYHNDNPGLHSSLADVLRDRFPILRAVGFDFISLTSWNHRNHGKESHLAFLGERNNFLIVEDMDLNHVGMKTKFNSLIMAPVRTVHGNGGPVTIIADIDEK